MSLAKPTISAADKLSELAAADRKTLWHRWLDWSLLVEGQDMFALFKSEADAGHLRRRFGTKEDLASLKQLIDRSRDKYARRWMRFNKAVKIFTFYMTVKMVVLSYVQFDLLRASFCPRTRSNCNRLDKDTLETIIAILGNPLGKLNDIAIQFQIGIVAIVFCNLLVVDWLDRHRKVKNSPLSFIFNPQFELKRIDSSIKRVIDELVSSSRIYQAARSAEYHKLRSSLMSKSHMLYNNLATRFQLDRLHQQKSQSNHQMRRILHCLRSEQRQLELLRPASLRPEFYSLTSKLSPLDGVALILVICGVVSVLLACILVPMNTRCQDLAACNPLQIMTWTELLITAEMVSLSIISFSLFAPSVLAAFLLIVSQFKMTQAARTDLTQCARHMRSIRELSETSSMREEKLLLMTLIKLTVVDGELCRNAQSIKLLATEQSYLLFGPALLVFLRSSLELPAVWYRSIMLLMGFIVANLFALLYAYTHTEASRLSREMWNLVAACYEANQDPLVNSNLLHQPENLEHTRQHSFVLDMLSRFTIASESNPKRHSVSALGFELTPGRVLQANSFFLFIYTFVTQMM